MRGGGEDESINIIFLHVLDALLLFEEIGRNLSLSYDDEVGLSEKAATERESAEAVGGDRLSHDYNPHR